MVKYTLKDKLTDKGYPVHTKEYQAAHRKANRAEKRASPADYKDVNALETHLPNGELLGKNLRNGKIEVSKKVPAKLRQNVATHEKSEYETMKKCGYCERSPCSCKK